MRASLGESTSKDGGKRGDGRGKRETRRGEERGVFFGVLKN